MHEILTAEFLERLAASDPAATEHFVAHFGGLVVIKLRTRKVDPGVAEEVRQETMARVLKALHRRSIHDPSRLGSFVNSTCNHVLSEHYRHESRFTPLDPQFDWRLAESDSEADLLREERSERIRTVLNRLSARDRAILRAVFLEERDKDEICRELGVDRDYLRVLLHRAKAAFLEEFRP